MATSDVQIIFYSKEFLSKFKTIAYVAILSLAISFSTLIPDVEGASSVKVIIGQKLKLLCSLKTADQRCTWIGTKNQVLNLGNPPEGNYKITQNHSICSLSFTRINVDDLGLWKCSPEDETPPRVTFDLFLKEPSELTNAPHTSTPPSTAVPIPRTSSSIPPSTTAFRTPPTTTSATEENRNLPVMSYVDGPSISEDMISVNRVPTDLTLNCNPPKATPTEYSISWIIDGASHPGSFSRKTSPIKSNSISLTLSTDRPARNVTCVVKHATGQTMVTRIFGWASFGSNRIIRLEQESSSTESGVIHLKCLTYVFPWPKIYEIEKIVPAPSLRFDRKEIKVKQSGMYKCRAKLHDDTWLDSRDVEVGEFTAASKKDNSGNASFMSWSLVVSTVIAAARW